MTVHAKLMQARLALQKMPLKKSGKNSFAGYEYFELGDFLPAVQTIFADVGLCGVVSFAPDVATLTITDTTSGAAIAITSPMAEANLKGCHPIQNLGAVETYTRRYLWVTAMEIVEHDALDATTGKGSPRHSPTDGVTIAPDRMAIINDVADAMREKFGRDDLAGAYEEYIGVTDGDEKIALWTMLKADSALRREIKAYGEKLRAK